MKSSANLQRVIIVRVLSCNLISERELSWCLVAVSVDFLVPMEILSWQIPTFALNKGAHLPLVPTRPHHVEVRRGFRDPHLYYILVYYDVRIHIV